MFQQSVNVKINYFSLWSFVECIAQTFWSNVINKAGFVSYVDLKLGNIYLTRNVGIALINERG